MLKPAPRPGPHGLTLIEVVVALALIGVLAALAYPSYVDQLRKSRRSDAITRLAHLQQAEERWRANHPGYATLAELGLAAETGEGLYRLSTADVHGAGYEALAQATGAQAADAACRFLRVTVSGGNSVLASGPDADTDNDADINRRCWNQ